MLCGLTSDALGVVVLKVKGVTDLEPLRAALVEKPWRRVFLQYIEDSSQPDGYQLCVGSQCLEPSLDFKSLLAKL